jgi:hypothetical protein
MRFTVRLRSVRQLLTVLLSACTGAASSAPISRGMGDRPAAPEMPARSEPVYFPVDSLRVALEFPERVRVGQAVSFNLRLRNPTLRPIPALLLGHPVPSPARAPVRRPFGLVITTPEGVRVWRMLRHRDWASSPHTFAPGEVLVLQDIWLQEDDTGRRVPPGTYYIVARLTPAGPSAGPKPLVITR